MKRKALALILCLAVIITVALPGTLAVSMDQETTTTTLTVGAKSKTDPQPTTEPPAPTEVADTTPAPTTQGETTENGTPDPSTPETTVPETTVPETTVPETTVPETTAPQCTCAATDGNHAEGCELYVEPEETEPEIVTETTVTVRNGITDHAPAFSTAGPLIQFDTPAQMSLFSAFSSRFASTFAVEARDGDGSGGTTTSDLQLRKNATANQDGSFTITLEAFATGQSITTYVKDGVDIVLMLDLSNYMGKTVTREETTTTYAYSQVNTRTYLSQLSNESNYYFYRDGENYYPVTVTTAGSIYNTTYTIKYTKDGTEHTIVDGRGGNTRLNQAGSNNSSVTLYTRTETTNTTTTTTYDTSDKTKLIALQNAVNGFIDKVHDEAPSSRIAIVSYGDAAHVLSGNGQATDAALVTVNDAGQTALKTIVNNLSILGGKSNSHLAAADAVKIFHAVPTNSAEYSRQRVSVLFSAGVPGDGWTRNSDKTGGKDIAMANMHLANILKTAKGDNATLAVGHNFDGGNYWSNADIQTLLGGAANWNNGCGSTFYCVGLDIPTSGDPQEIYMGDDPYKNGALSNEYFWRISSHRPDGSHITNASDLGSQGTYLYNNRLSGTNYGSLYYFYPDGATRNQTNGYYLTTESGSGLGELTRIFDSIAGQATTTTGTSTTLGTTAVVKDIIAPEFKLPEGATADNITITSYKFTSMNGEEYQFSTTPMSTSATATVDANGIVSVTGFNFSDNWCGTSTAQNGQQTAHGSKLVISFKVVTKPGFLGGNNVYTNTSAGVYADSNATTPVQEFERPQVNVQIPTVTVTPAEKNVYLLGSLTGDQIKSGATATCGDASLSLDPTAINYGLEEWQNAYVDITVSYQDANGNTVTALSDLKDDTTYKVLVTVAPKEEAKTTSSGTAAAANMGEGTGNINVFQPTLTFKDSTVYYGDTAPTNPSDYNTNNYVASSTVWKHGETLSTTVAMTGTVPTLTLGYAPGTGIVDGKVATKNDIPVDVTVKIGTTDVTSNTTFVHTKCDASENDPTDGKFWLHVKTCSLTITKAAGTNTTIGNDEYFVFNIKKDGVAYTQVTIQGTGSVTISELPVGSYTVEEDAATAWRYTSAMSPESATLSKTNTSATITCTNTIENDKWLNDFTQVINTFGDKKN